MSTAPKFRIDVDIHNLLTQSSPEAVKIPTPKGMTLPEPVFPQYRQKLSDPGPATPPARRGWKWPEVYRKMRGWLFPIVPDNLFSPANVVLILPGQSRSHIDSNLLIADRPRRLRNAELHPSLLPQKETFRGR
jgi:hypothetical protein